MKKQSKIKKRKQEKLKNEIIIVLIPTIISLLLGIGNLLYNKKISERQNKIEIKKSQITLLDERRKKIENIKAIIAERSIDAREIDSIDSARLIYFQENFRNTMSISHLLNTDFIDELKELDKRIGSYIFNSKKGIPNNSIQVKNDLELMSEMSGRIKDEIDISLIKIENKIDKLLK